MTEDFQASGISLVAISNEDRPALRKSLDGYEDGFPFPLLADAALEAFRGYGAFDELMGTALHGTFLIDAEGRIRWWDIGHEPFDDAAFLLTESQRLLALDPISSGFEFRSRPAAPTRRVAEAPATEAGRR